MKTYKYGEWDWVGHGTDHEEWDFEKRIYIDKDGNRITGMLYGYFYFKKDDPRNNVYVENGKRK